MSFLSLEGLSIRDIRRDLKRAGWSIGTRPSQPMSITLHYNGPAVSNRTHDGEVAQLKFDASFHMRPGVISSGGADGVQYHYAVLADGTIYQTRDIDAILWHCANATGNDTSIAIHLPLGDDQDATDVQWDMTTRLFDALMKHFAMHTRQQVKGHLEWSDTKCPGSRLWPRLQAWRRADPDRGGRFQIVHDEANLRIGPGLDQVVIGVLMPGDIYEASEIQGEWASNFYGAGFVHTSLLKEQPIESTPPATYRFEVVWDEANVRQGPGLRYPIAKIIHRGSILTANAIQVGEPIADNARWVHLADGAGFMHTSLLEQHPDE